MSRVNRSVQRVLVGCVLYFGWLCAAGCGRAAVQKAAVRFGDGSRLLTANLGSCDDSARELVLNPNEPVTVLVHGCNFSNGRFRTLARVFEARNQQTVCFNYDDRDALEVSSGQLRTALMGLQGHLHTGEITIVGHSQGGLVAHRALIEGRRDGAIAMNRVAVRLVTVSSPFAGIRAASDCGSLPMHIVTLGISAAVCQLAAGNKWMEIHSKSNFILHPGTLVSPVNVHVKVVTDEEGTCLRADSKGRCEQSDFVFSLKEQYQPAIDEDRRVVNRAIKAGHSEIVGQSGSAPWKLIHILEGEKILEPVLPEQTEAAQAQVEALYAPTRR